MGYRFVRKFVRRANTIIFGVAASSRVTSVIYNWIIFWPFSREQQAFLKGKYHFYKNLNQDAISKPALRRNIHRLEKAMTFKDRLEIFGLELIGQTVEYYERAVDQYKKDADSIDQNELAWAHDVLQEYFSVIKHNDFTTKLKSRFEATDFNPKDNPVKAPYKRNKSAESTISYKDLLALSMRRRTVRWFLQKPVPRELIDKAILIGRQAPTACNRLPYEFRIYDDPKLVSKVATTPMGTGGYAYNIPVIVVIVGKLDNYFSSRDRHAIYTDASLAAMGFMYGLETLGLSSGVINWPDFEPLEMKMKKLLNLAVDERPIMLMSVGYADPEGMIAFSEKKSLESLRSYNKI